MTKRPSKRRAKAKAVHRTHAPTKAKLRARKRMSLSRAKTFDPLDNFVDAAVLALDLPLDPSWRAAVKLNLQVTLRQAALFAEFDLPDEAEPAPVFRA
jgi:hypothetical protein